MFNPVVVAVALVLTMCVLRVNVVIALTVGALACGMIGGSSPAKAIAIFCDGLGGGAKIALSYAILGAFASALAHSGFPDFLMRKVTKLLRSCSGENTGGMRRARSTKIVLFTAIGLMSIACKNVIPVHIAFIPILIPPLLGIFNGLRIDRRSVACIITFGVIVAYMVVPIGFGEIFLVNILLHYLRVNGLEISLCDAIHALLLPVIGMAIGLAVALVKYGKPRDYGVGDAPCAGDEKVQPRRKHLIVSCASIGAALAVQLVAKDIILGALAGILVLSFGGAIGRHDSDNVVVNGFRMMTLISFTMLAAAGFGHAMRESGGIGEIVNWLSSCPLNGKAVAAFGMLLVGFLVSVGIGSSFSTVPIVASVYVPLGLKLGFSPAAIAVIVAISGVTGDAGSPASDSTLGPTMGLNADGRHSLISDTVMPTFSFLTVPAFIFGWIASIIL